MIPSAAPSTSNYVRDTISDCPSWHSLLASRHSPSLGLRMNGGLRMGEGLSLVWFHPLLAIVRSSLQVRQPNFLTW